MFGYIRPHIPALRVAEYEYYRAIYCGICRYHGEAAGAFSRLTLSYDAVFLALIRLTLTDKTVSFRRKRCAANPLTKRTCAVECDEIRYAAAATSLLAALKFEDDVADESGARRFAAKTCRIGGRRWKARVEASYPDLCASVSSALGKLYEAEQQADASPENISVDTLADLFGNVMSTVLSYRLDAEKKKIAAAVGRRIGRWLYCIDALDDLEDDAQKGRFNPFLSSYSSNKLSDEEKTTVSCLLAAETGSALAALDLIERDCHPQAWAIIDNILGIGLPRVSASVLDGTYRKPQRDKIEISEETVNAK